MKLVYEGKAKKVFEQTDHLYLLEFKDSLTAFNAQKLGSFSGKGELNRNFASFVFRKLREQGIPSHWVEDVDQTKMIVQKLSMLPCEVVVRNFIAGSLAKKFGLPEGEKLQQPLVEFYYKKDELNDPFMSEDQMLSFGFATEKQIREMKQAGLKINQVMKDLFNQIKIDLIDFKVEFGVDLKNEIVLADEISPDSCRLWDQATKQKLDKDVFRRDLGNVQTAYEEVWNRLTQQG